jgi:hypothetical protein
MKKKLLIAAGVIFGLFLILAIVLPLVIDVDKFRPKIVSAVNEKINGEFKLGKLQLSLWGGVKVRIESLSITETGAKKPLVETNSAYMEIPLLSLITLSPSLTAVLDAPKVNVIKFKNGKMNVTELMKPTALKEPTPKQEATPSSGMPAMLANASVGFRIEKGVIAYTDEGSNSKYSIDGLELDAQNIGLHDTMKISVKMPIKGSTPTMTVDGLVSANAQIKPILAGGEVRSASGTIDADATGLAFKINNGMVNKTPKTPLVFTADFVGTENDVTIKSADFKFDELAVNAKGLVILQPKQSVKMDITSSKLNLASLEKFVPMLKEYGLAGMAGMNVHAEGPTDQLVITGDLSVKGGKANYPAMLKAPIGFDVRAGFTDKSLTLNELSVSAPDTEVKLTGTVKDFKAPQFAFNLTGKELNVDKLMKSEPPPPKKEASYFSILPEAEAKPVHKEAPKKSAKGPAKEESQAVATSGANPMLSLAKNPMVANAAGSFNVNLTKVIAKNATISDINAKINLKNMNLNVPSATLKMFEGALSTNFNANLKSAGLNFSTTGTMSNLNTVPACQAFAPKFQHTLEGKINAKWSMEGIAFPTTALMHNLKGNASITSENGKLRTMDIGESIKGVFGKVSFLQGKSIPSIDENYKSMRAEIKMANGVVTADPLEVIGSNKGVNVKGRSTIQENMNQETFVDVYDPNHLLPKEVSNGKDAALQLHITGPATAPVTDYGYTVGKLAKNVVRNQGADLIKKALGGKGGGGSSDAIGGALKKLGF